MNNLFEQVLDIDNTQIKDHNPKSKNDPLNKQKKSKKIKEFNKLEEINENQKLKESIKNYNYEYKFDNYKNNIFTLYLNCKKFIQKPYYDFNEFINIKNSQKLFLFNNDFNDYILIIKNKIIFNLDNFKIISYIVNNFKEIIKKNNIKYIISFNRNIPIEYFIDMNILYISDLFIEAEKSKCLICPFYNLKNKDCNLK